MKCGILWISQKRCSDVTATGDLALAEILKDSVTKRG